MDHGSPPRRGALSTFRIPESASALRPNISGERILWFCFMKITYNPAAGPRSYEGFAARMLRISPVCGTTRLLRPASKKPAWRG